MTLPPSSLPPPPPTFQSRKQTILANLAVPDASYTDASPKGSVDAGIRHLINEINGFDGFVTTSSCAGRVSVFVEGRKRYEEVDLGRRLGEKGQKAEENGNDAVEEEDAQEKNGDGQDQGGETEYIRPATVAGVGGKGGGGTWLFVSHDPIEEIAGRDVRGLLGLGGNYVPSMEETAPELGIRRYPDPRFIHFKFEPMILHILTASPDHAHVILKCGLQAGFRESGAINIARAEAKAATPIVAIRSMGLALESLVGMQLGDGAGDVECTVSKEYLETLVNIANERFVENSRRIVRFREALLGATGREKEKRNARTGWEDTIVRRERKRLEGLRRKAELQNTENRNEDGSASNELDDVFNAPLGVDFT